MRLMAGPKALLGGGLFMLLLHHTKQRPINSSRVKATFAWM